MSHDDWIADALLTIPLNKDFIDLLKEPLSSRILWIVCAKSPRGHILVAKRKDGEGVQEFWAHECTLTEGVPAVWANISPDHRFCVKVQRDKVTLEIHRRKHVAERMAS